MLCFEEMAVFVVFLSLCLGLVGVDLGGVTPGSSTLICLVFGTAAGFAVTDEGVLVGGLIFTSYAGLLWLFPL